LTRATPRALGEELFAESQKKFSVKKKILGEEFFDESQKITLGEEFFDESQKITLGEEFFAESIFSTSAKKFLKITFSLPKFFYPKLALIQRIYVQI
jgi:hypothetical protein